MVVTDVLTKVWMLLCGVLALLLALFKFPELSALCIIGCYYFAIFHIAHVVGDNDGWYRKVLPTFFGLLTITILVFAIIYYRYGLLQNGKEIEITLVEAIYFSVTTWTTLGYGDFAPIPRLRHITSVEAVLGYIGLGLWISLISSYIRNMSENRREIRKHNSQLVKNMKDNRK